MNSILLMLAAHLAVMSSQFGTNVQVADHVWHQYRQQYNKSYSSHDEELLRRQVFAYNHHKINKFNQQKPDASYKLGVNHMSDWTEKEFKAINGLKVPKGYMANITTIGHDEINELLSITDDKVPDSVDWRTNKGVVSPVKNQGHCGSCWAFSTIGLLEGQELKTTKKGGDLISLSEQQVLDCDDVDQGCNGGIMSQALVAINKMGGVESEADYPYLAVQLECNMKKDKVVMSDKAFEILKQGDEELLKKTVAFYGPVSVVIQATNNMQHYKRGILDDEDCSGDMGDLNHAVLVVGYGSDKTDGDYWIVKNSWGSDWGEKGYIRMSRNQGNQCGIASIPTIATF